MGYVLNDTKIVNLNSVVAPLLGVFLTSEVCCAGTGMLWNTRSGRLVPGWVGACYAGCQWQWSRVSYSCGGNLVTYYY